MSKIDYPRTSPYFGTPQTNWYLGRYEHRSIAPSSADKQIVISSMYQYRPDRLSQDLYGTPAYWWIFAIRNPDEIRDPIWDFTAGKTIYAPAVEALSTLGT